ncbi:hypothetical protein BG004_000646, partial [Podila humilis]
MQYPIKLFSDPTTSRIASKTAKLTLSSSSVYPFEDVTSLLNDATKDMKTGQLVQVESFSLFDAMCAIVIMDPKMDTGMIVDDYSTRPQYNVNQPISPRNLIWIIDNILVGQMTWLSGHALSQTLFTSCYILRAMEIKDDQEDSPLQPPIGFVTNVLKPCVIAIAKTCGMVWEEMRKGQVYEEEDFMTNKFGVSMYETLPLSTTIALLDQAEYWMEKKGKSWIEAHEDNIGAQPHQEIIKAIQDRISYTRVSLLAIYQVLAPKCSQFQNALPQLQLARELISRLKASNALGMEIPDAFDHSIHRKLVTNTPPRAIALLTLDETFDHLERMLQDLSWIGGALEFPDGITLMNFFIQFGAKKPSPGAFPRSVLQTVLYEDKVIMGSRLVTEIVTEIIRDTVQPVQWIFENMDDEVESTNHRSLKGESGDMTDAEAMKLIPIQEEEEEEEEGATGVHDQTISESVVESKRMFRRMFVEFVERATKPFVDTLQIMGQNVARQRRNLRKIVQLWEALQEQAEMLDDAMHTTLSQIQLLESSLASDDGGLGDGIEQEAPNPFYFVSWAYHMKLWVMEWMLLLGSELELYSSFEYSMVYGYCDIIMGAHSRHLRRVQNVMDSEMESQRNKIHAKINAAAAKKKKKKKKKKSTTTAGKGEDTLLSTIQASTSPSSIEQSSQLL